MTEIIHIFDSKNVHLNPDIIENIQKHIDKGHEHFYYISLIGSKNEKEKNVYDKIKESGANILYISSIFDYLKVFGLKVNVIIMHGLISPYKKQLLLLILIYLFYPSLLKKIILVAWGGSDFNLNTFYLVNWLHNKIVNTFKKVLTLSHADKVKYEKVYGKESIIVKYLILNNHIRDLSKVKSDRKYKIMISHSGWPHNFHIEAFDLIKDKITKDTEIICPLAYGDADYIGKVINLGKELFHSNFTYFTELKSKEDYELLLSEVDIYVTLANIQTGLFAINSCLVNGSKIFCRENLLYSLIYDGFKVFDVSEVTNMTQEEFYFISEQDKINNKSIYDDKYKNIAEEVTKWNKIYSNTI